MSEVRRLATTHSRPFWGGIVVAALVFVFWRPEVGSQADPRQLAAVAALALLMATWWISEAVPIPVTSLLPLVLLPVLAGAPFDLSRVAANYANWRVFLYFGGFLIAIAMETSGLHRRVALYTVRAIGTRPRRIVLGFMVASAVLSMWISNTATALMMLPIALAVVAHFEKKPAFSIALLLGTAYGASIGGVATPIGTPPNIAFLGIYSQLYPQAPPIQFGQWMAFALPVTLVFLPIAWLFLVRDVEDDGGDASAVLEREISEIGPALPVERRVFVVFVSMAVLLIFRQPIALPFMTIPGWAGLLPGAAINDGVVAMALGLLLFVLPSGGHDGRPVVLDWQQARRKMPWGILLLFGGGYALADAIAGAGLAGWVGAQLEFVQGASPVVLTMLSATLLTFMTEITSNTATAQIMLPLAAAVAVDTAGVNPLIVMLPVTLAASFAFMLPVATPPNAVIFGSGAVPMRAMVRTGLWLNLIGIVLLTLLCLLLGPLVFGIDFGGGVPDWAL
ncbi:MAG: DASS family sodium-coupled anion symporter [Acidobacteria bacterium]|nr:DASS family sodium-coupled anion symporter [Acidobacteriota bacterium]